MVVAWLVDGLYQLDKSSFNDQIIEKFAKYRGFPVFHAINKDKRSGAVDKWHIRLGHASLDRLSHISDVVINSTSRL